jgi:hypothetical protein
MNKEKIQEIAQNFLNEPYSDETLGRLAEKNHKKFLNNLSKLDERQINKILKAYPEYSNKVLDGWHSLHFVALLNDPNILESFMKNAINNGLTSLPKTTKEKKDIPENISFLNFCAANNCDKSFVKILTYLSNPEEQNFNEAIIYSLHYGNSKVIKFLEKVMVKEDIQSTMLSYFNDRPHRLDFLWKTTTSVEKLNNMGVDIKYEEDNKRNYFTLVLESMNNNYYDIEQKGFDYIRNTIDQFMDSGFSLDIPDKKGNMPRASLELFIKNTYSNSLQEKLEEYMLLLNSKSLNNDLVKKNNVEPKKFKI